MALGNANSSAQSRGKNKAVVVKRRKEVVIAKDYNTVTMSPVQASVPAACSYSGGGFKTYYHNGSSAAPARDDIVYDGKRARNPNTFNAGFYQTSVGKSKFALEIDASGQVRAVNNCP